MTIPERCSIPRRHQHGFTLIELMIVIGIIGILSVVALPAYQDYIARAQTSEAIDLMSGLRTPMVGWFATEGEWPDIDPDAITNLPAAEGEVAADLDLDAAVLTGRYVTAIRGQVNGANSARYTLTAQMHATDTHADISGRLVSMQTSDGGRNWSCGPGVAVNGVAGDAVTIQRLPSACRQEIGDP
ncbi:MAG: pilin [Magnetococcales bacterium]|nr:pilin [Magnetococcales bacterium]